MNSDSLQHYGILGMKWGVRRTPEQLGHTKTGEYVPHTVKKGTKLYRVSANPGDAKGTTYFTMLPPDRDFYRGPYSRTISKQQGGDGSAYETTYTTNSDLKIANRQDMVKEFSAIQNDRDAMFEMLVDYSNSLADKNVKMGRISEDERTQFGEVKLKELVTTWGDKPYSEAFTDMARGMTISTPVFREKIIDSLKQKGFNGYIDEAGVGGLTSPREGVEPLVIFDAEKTVTKKSDSPINYATMYGAQQRYNDWFRKANSSKNTSKGAW